MNKMKDEVSQLGFKHLKLEEFEALYKVGMHEVIFTSWPLGFNLIVSGWIGVGDSDWRGQRVQSLQIRKNEKDIAHT